MMVLKQKKIENRSCILPRHKENRPILIHISKTKCLEQKANIIKTMHGKIIGFCKFQNVTKEDAFKLDPTYTQPNKKHWYVLETVLFDEQDWIQQKGFQSSNPCQITNCNILNQINKTLLKYDHKQQ